MTCAFAVRGALKKIPGVESVDVSLNKGLATVKLKPGNTAKPEEFWETVKKNGFSPKETRVVVRGEIINSGKPQLKVVGTGQLFDLTGDARVLSEVKAAIGKPITAEGALLPGKDVRAAIPLKVRVVRTQ